MPDNRSLNPYKKFYPAPEIQSYKIISDKCFRGFRNEIVWTHSDKSTRIFRIYRAKIGAVATKKKYTIDNLALQRLTQLKSYDLPNKTLYDKSLFVQNSKVSFAQSDTTRHDQVGSDPTTFVYKEVGYVRANKTKSFKFIDRDVKFGQTYSYVITGLNNFLRESQKSQPLIVTTELVEMTPLLTYLSGCTIPEGILLRMGSDKGDQVRGFEVFRLDEETKRFEKIFFNISYCR